MEERFNIGERLKGLRGQKECSQEEVAEMLGITVQAYSQYECSRRRPSYEILVKLRDYYGVSLDYLICGEERRNLLYDKLVFTKATRLPDCGKEELFHFMQFLAAKYKM